MTGRPRTRAMVMKDLECQKCGEVFSIPRRAMRNKKEGHKKRLWCYRCKKRTTHVELSDQGERIGGRK